MGGLSRTKSDDFIYAAKACGEAAPMTQAAQVDQTGKAIPACSDGLKMPAKSGATLLTQGPAFPGPATSREGAPDRNGANRTH